MVMRAVLMQRTPDDAVGDDAAELPDRPKRRYFGAEHNLRIVAEYDACVGDGDKGELLRREGLYLSHIVEWPRAREAAASGLASRVRGPKADPDVVALERIPKRIERLEGDLAKHRLARDIARKAHALLLEKVAESATDEPGPGSERGPGGKRRSRRTSPISRRWSAQR